MDDDIRVEAFTLTSIPFKDYDRILTLFSKEKGLIKLMIKGANRPKSNRLIFAQPLTQAQYILRKSRGDFHHFVEGKLIDPFLSLRESYEALQSSFDLTFALLKTSVEQQPSKDLFILLQSYLTQLPSSQDPTLLVASFYLKLLLYDGCLSLKKSCSRCASQPLKLYFCFKDYYCENCTPSKHLFFSQDELSLILSLIKERSFNQLKAQVLPQGLYKKIRSLFAQLHEIEL